LPFLDGLRRCAGMALAQLQFAALLYAMVVPWRVDLGMPAVGPLLGGRAECECAGGGLALVPGSSCVARAGCLAGIVEPRLPFTTPSRLDLLRGAEDSALHFRMHIVKRADMFTTWDGHMPYHIQAL